MTGRRALYGWLTSEAVSLTGTRVSMVALPWFVLTSTGSATRTGLTAFAEMLPYVLVKAASGPWVDRLGARRVSIACDLLSVVAVGAIPLLYAGGVLSFPLLLVAVAVAGALRGPGDGARHALVPTVVKAAGVPLERATGLSGAVERLASTVGAAFAGALVALVGPAQAIAVDAASFAVSALLLAVTVPRDARRERPAPGGERRYLADLAEGWSFLRGDAVLVAMVTMIALTNLLDAAYVSVLVPVWAERSGGGAAAIGLLLATFSAAAVLGSVLAAAWASRLPRFTTYAVAFLVCGVPRFVVLAVDVPLGVVLAVAVAAGFGSGFINPILGAVVYERIPEQLMGRVTTLSSSLSWSGIPLGGLLGGLLVSGLGLAPALLVAGGCYFAATLLPVLNPSWRRLDGDRDPTATAGASAGGPEDAPVVPA